MVKHDGFQSPQIIDDYVIASICLAPKDDTAQKIHVLVI